MEELEAATKGYNNTSNSHLGNQSPNDVIGNNSLIFALKKDAAEGYAQNSKLIEQRAKRLTDAGGFRTISDKGLHSKFSRSFKPTWQAKVHTVADPGTVQGGTVKDTEGKEFATKFVLPSSTTSLPVSFPAYAEGGSAQIDDRRREALQHFVPALELRVQQTGTMSLGQVGVFLKSQAGFSQELRNQRSTVKQFVQLFPSTFSLTRRGKQSHRVSLKNPPEFRRLRRMSDVSIVLPPELPDRPYRRLRKIAE